MHPAGRVNRLAGPLLIPPIAEHDQIAARQQFAGGAARHDAALGIDDLDLDMRQYPSDGRHPPLDRIVGRRGKARRAGLGHAVADDDLREMHQRAGPFHDLDRARAAGHHAGAQRGKIEFPEFGMIHLGDEHRRHAVHRRAALGRDGLEGGERVEAFAREDHRRTVRQAAKIADYHAEAVVERHRDAHAVALAQPHRLGDEKAVVENIVVRQRGTLRKPCRAAGELDVDRVVELQLAGEGDEAAALGLAGEIVDRVETQRARRRLRADRDNEAKIG